MQRLGQLIAISVFVWVVAAYPAYRLGGEQTLVHSAVAALLCLVPAAASLALARRSFGSAPEQRLLFTLGGTGLRMFLVLGVVALLYLNIPYFQPTGFVLWVLGFYLLTLALEVTFLVQELAATDQPANQPQP
ncbi:hypothetical protein AYO44_16240 [Planctomycetaceae bacterium SCGC AG-212-F19]|nr:hypothetical protein AYO44_16240 [Planctomycetaceae bacterium SCGC AG-212-F19]